MNLNSIIKAAKAYPKVDVGQRYEFYEIDASHAAKAISVLADQRDRLAAELRLIAETDDIDLALDPQRAKRIARAALAELDKEQE